MADSVKATHATVMIGSKTVDGFMLPDGSYRMSQQQAAESIDEPPVYALRFLRSKDSKALLENDFTDYIPESVEVEPQPGRRGQTRFNALPLGVVAAYWLSRAHRGNKKAFLLCWALITESLERRFDRAFGVVRNEDSWDEQLAARQLENMETFLASAWAEIDASHNREQVLEQQLRELGVEPWELTNKEIEE